MKINLVNYEAAMGIDGILTKYCRSMQRELAALGTDCRVAPTPDPQADVNHHVNYLQYRHPAQRSGIDTLMITHFTQGTDDKLRFIQDAMRTADCGICFSSTMVRYLQQHGVPHLDHVLPAHDNIPPRPKVIALLTKVYPDGRKREWMVAELAKTLDKSRFNFLVMGDGWQPTLAPLAQQGFRISFQKEFDAELHQKILNSADFVLYTGDEDCMPQSIIDATQAGVRTIAPRHEWQQDLAVDHSFTTQDELNAIFATLARNPVADWTWKTYSERHLAIWRALRR
jgi:hypothetical protein